MWVSKAKYDALCKRIDELEKAVNIEVWTGEMEYRPFKILGAEYGSYPQCQYELLPVKDAIGQIMKHLQLCAQYTPEQPAKNGFIEIKKCATKKK